MKCPFCGTVLPLNADRCPDCGYHCGNARPQVQSAAAVPGPGVPYDPPNKTRRPKFCCCCAALVIIPLLLLLLGAIGLGIYAVVEQVPLEDFGFDFEYDFGYYEDAPSYAVPESLPAEAAEGAFSIRDGEITFLPDRWNGGAVLRIPETVDGQTVTALAPGCFAGCTELTTIVLPDSITSIGPEAFAGCTELRGLLVPIGTVSIGTDAFAGCINLESLYVPGSVAEIAPGCLDDCASLLYIFYDGTFENWNALYSDYITPFTTAICADGAYYHGAAG